jgi:succinyl-CoA synthetase beta subunit
MDCELVSRGTGTPVPGGISQQQATDLVLTLLESPKVCCFEMVEINPILDTKGNMMADTAFKILEQATKTIEGRPTKAFSLQNTATRNPSTTTTTITSAGLPPTYNPAKNNIII